MSGNPSAFPNHPGTDVRADNAAEWSGMTLRDWFAGQALGGIIGHMPAEAVADITQGIRAGMPIAYGAYALADAMLALRQARPLP